MQGWEGDEVVFVISVDVQQCVADLLDVDGATERGLLSVVAFEAYAVLA